MALTYQRIAVGDRFGMLVVVSEAPRGFTRSGEPKRKWHCVCDCGGQSTVIGGNLRTGTSASCGCRKRSGHGSITHGMSSDPHYAVWQSMIGRCTRASDPRYADYGGRGVSVCPRWAGSFESFITDMGRRPSDDHSIERIDNSGDYEPSNCRWATAVEQGRNSRRNRIVTFDGQEMPLSEACELSGIPYGRIKNRLRDGWPDETLFSPLSHRRRRKDAHWVEVNGEKVCLTEAAERVGLTYACVFQRLRRGWPLEKALTP